MKNPANSNRRERIAAKKTLPGAGIIAVTGLFFSSVAQAHPLFFGETSWAAGFVHPWLGADHVLAMLAVGLWAAQQGGGRLWQLPLAFLGMMIVGAWAGQNGLVLPAVEAGVASSLLVLGLMLAFAVRLPIGPNLLMVGCFALFHGHAHGAEMPQSLAALGYASGFIVATDRRPARPGHRIRPVAAPRAP